MMEDDEDATTRFPFLCFSLSLSVSISLSFPLFIHIFLLKISFISFSLLLLLLLLLMIDHLITIDKRQFVSSVLSSSIFCLILLLLLLLHQWHLFFSFTILVSFFFLHFLKIFHWYPIRFNLIQSDSRTGNQFINTRWNENAQLIDSRTLEYRSSRVFALECWYDSIGLIENEYYEIKVARRRGFAR